jgi:hypothetical protein
MEYARCILCQNRVQAVSRGTGIPTDYSPPVTFDAPRSSSHATVDRGNIKTIGPEMSTSFTTLHVTHTNRVAHAVIDAPPINLIGPEFISDLVRLIEYAENSEGVWKLTIAVSACSQVGDQDELQPIPIELDGQAVVDSRAAVTITETARSTAPDQASFRDRRNILSAAHWLPMATAAERISALEHGLLVF